MIATKNNIPTLRDYQVRAEDMARESFKMGFRRVIMSVATGGGKTTIASSMISQTVEKGNRVVFLAHRKELVEQAKNRLQQFGIRPGVIMAGWRQVDRPVMVASLQTLIRRTPPKADLVIVDECHHSTSKSFRKLLDHYQEQGAFILGLTATPYRMDGKSLGDIYQHIVAPIGIQELIDRGYLVKPKYIAPKIDLQRVKVKRGDYDASELFRRFDSTDQYHSLVENYKEWALGKSIIFNVNVEHSIKVAQALNDAGIRTAHVDGETPAIIRANILTDFKKGNYDVLCNVNLFTEGFDVPEISTVILNRATKSKSLYFQMVGRGLRPFQDKDHCLVLDQGGNVWEHGPVEEREEFSLEVSKKKSKLTGIAPVKDCPSCGYISPIYARKCEECGHAFQMVSQAQKEGKEAEYAEIEAEEAKKRKTLPPHLQKPFYTMTAEELEEVRNLRSYKVGWCVYKLKEIAIQRHKGSKDMFKKLLQEYQAIRGYKNGWVLLQLKQHWN